MTFERIIFTLVVLILIFIIVMAVRKIKNQEKTIAHLQRINELQGKVEDGTLDVG